MYDFNAIQSNAIFGGMEGWGYRKIKLFGNMYACLYFTFFLVDKMNHKLKQLMKCTYTFAEYKNEDEIVSCLRTLKNAAQSFKTQNCSVSKEKKTRLSNNFFLVFCVLYI